MNAARSHRIDSDALKRAVDPVAFIGEFAQLTYRKEGKDHVALCPFHQENTPSFKVNEKGWKCFGCGLKGDVFRFVQEYKSISYQEALAIVSDYAKLPAFTPIVIQRKPAKTASIGLSEIPSNVTVRYPYHDEFGVLLYEIWRQQNGSKKSFKVARPVGDRWVYGINDETGKPAVRAVLFNLQAVSESEIVGLCCGEKDALNLAAVTGIVATTKPFGEKGWTVEYSEQLRDKIAFLFADMDDTGQQYAEEVKAGLEGIAQAVYVVPIAVGKDISDWIEAGATKEDIESAMNAVRFNDPAADQEDDSDKLIFYQNDTGNANRLVKLFGHLLAHCGERKVLAFWTGKRWQFDQFVQVEKLAEKAMLAAYKEAADFADPAARKAFLRHVNGSLSRAGIANMIHLAKKKVRQVSATEFDANPILLNCQNGTINLATGELQPHRPEDFCSKMIEVKYDPRAKCPQFMRFIAEALGGRIDPGNNEARQITQRAVDYVQVQLGCATTGNPAKVLIIWYGKWGNNGKTTLVELARYVLGPYAGEIQIDSLMVRRPEAVSSNAINSDLSDLQGCRFVSSSEPGKGQQLSLARVKYLTGMGQIRARRMAENFITFQPVHKLFLDCNDRPIITDPNDAIWNRIKCVEFRLHLSDDEIDTALPARLRTETPGILNWFVEGAKRYLADPKVLFQAPPEVVAAGESYKNESGQLDAYLKERCVLETGNKDCWVGITDLFQSYQSWAEQRRETSPLTRDSFAEQITKLGCVQDRRRKGRGRKEDPQVRVWVGVRFRTQKDEMPEAQVAEESTV